MANFSIRCLEEGADIWLKKGIVAIVKKIIDRTLSESMGREPTRSRKENNDCGIGKQAKERGIYKIYFGHSHSTEFQF